MTRDDGDDARSRRFPSPFPVNFLLPVGYYLVGRFAPMQE